MLPKGAGVFKLGTGMEVDQTAGGIEYRRHASIDNGVFTIEKTERSLVPEFPAKDAPAHQAALRMLSDRMASIRMPVGYKYSGDDISAVQADVPTTSAGYVSRAKAFLDRGMRKEALLDYDKAVQLDSSNVYAWANRAITRVQNGDLAGAKSDLAKAEGIDPAFVQNAIVRGMLADVERRPRDAVEAYSRALEQEPDNQYAIAQRAAAYAQIGDKDKATADLTLIIQKQPEEADGYIGRGNFFLNQANHDKALADFDKAVALEPGNEWAMADRGITYVWKRDYAAAKRDLDAVAAINPKNAVMLRARGLMAQQKGEWQDAIAAYTSALEVEPMSGFTLAHRAEAERAAGDSDAALRDTATALKQQPDWIDLYLLRANILRGQGKTADALAEARAATTTNPENSYAYVVAGAIYNTFHKEAEAMNAFDKAIAIKPEAYIYLNRSNTRPKADVAGRRADLEAALKLEPDLTEAVSKRAELEAESGNLPGAIATYSAALAKSPDNATLLMGRGLVYARSGNTASADDDFQKVERNVTEPVVFNNLCWAKATAGVALQSALANCDRALAKMPDEAGFIDSRGLVLLRLGRWDDAIADYDRALAKSADMASSRFGRAVAWARKGDRTKSEQDAAAAEKADPNVRAEFERYGIKL